VGPEVKEQGRDPRARSVTEGPSTLLEQFGETKASFSRLIGAHVALLKAEIGEIVGLVKIIATLGAAALGVAFMVGTMLYVGGFLFMGEWLFGSIGWGLAHGVLFGVGIIVALVMGILGAPMGRALVAFVLGALVGVGVALLLGFNVAYNAASSAAAVVSSPINSAGAIALIGGAIIGALLFALLLWRVGGRGGAVAGLVIGLLLGGLIGWLMGGAPWTWRPAGGFGITIGILAWILLDLVLSIPGLDVGARFGGLYPKQSIEAANETKAWLEEQWRKRQPKLGRN
jgi:hypothetical protein